MYCTGQVGLQRLLLDSDEVRFQHNNLLTRSQGNPGGRWHCHRLHQPEEDDAGSTQTPPALVCLTSTFCLATHFLIQI